MSYGESDDDYDNYHNIYRDEFDIEARREIEAAEEREYWKDYYNSLDHYEYPLHLQDEQEEFSNEYELDRARYDPFHS